MFQSKDRRIGGPVRTAASRGQTITTYNADYGKLSGQRNSQKSSSLNTLLLHTPVGKAKQPCYALPSEDHVYGMTYQRRSQSVGEQILSSQAEQCPKSKKAVIPVDYIAMNKLCIEKHILDPRDQYKFIQENPVRVKVIDHSVDRRSVRRLPSDNDASYTYGKPSAESSTVARLMMDHYEQPWGDVAQAPDQVRRLKATAEVANAKARARQGILCPLQKPKAKNPTILERDPATLFKMPRFRGVEARVDCYQPDWHQNYKPSIGCIN